MKNQNKPKANYGNWLSRQRLLTLALFIFLLIVLSFISIYFIIPTLLFLPVFAYFAYSYYLFSPAGGNIQAKVWNLTLDNLKWDGNGRAIDIGCGSGAIVIKLATKYPGAQLTGIDFWGSGWEYSMKECENNAQIEGVADRVKFVKASASSLPFDNEYFDAAVSNFVFHEVQDTKDKREVIREALRVVKKGGVFAFHDLFLIKKLYGNIDDLLATIREWGIEEVEFINTSKASFVPALLKLPFMLGTIGIIHGRK